MLPYNSLKIPSGEVLNVETPYGATKACNTFPNFVALNIGNVGPHISRSFADSDVRRQLGGCYETIGDVAHNADPEVFGRTWGAEESAAVLCSHFVKVLSHKKAGSCHAKNSSPDSQSPSHLSSIVNASGVLLRHSSYAAAMFSTGCLSSLSSFLCSNLDPTLAFYGRNIFNNSLITLSMPPSATMPATMPIRKALEALDDAGMLRFFIVSFTAPPWTGPYAPNDDTEMVRHLRVFDDIEREAGFVRSRLGPATATGGLLRDVVNGKAGWRKARSQAAEAALRRVLPRLENLLEVARMASEGSKVPVMGGREGEMEAKGRQGRSCRFCGKMEGFEVKKMLKW